MILPPPDHRLYKLFISVFRIVTSFLSAGILNLIWTAAFLTFAGKPPQGTISWLLWCIAPPLTAFGFSYGIIIFDRLFFKKRDSILSVLPIFFVSCVIGAVVIIPIGQMFIGISMFICGGIALVLREVWLSRR